MYACACVYLCLCVCMYIYIHYIYVSHYLNHYISHYIYSILQFASNQYQVINVYILYYNVRNRLYL